MAGNITMPADLPQPVEVGGNYGVLLPAEPIDVVQSGNVDQVKPYDPWTDANLALMADHSQPATGPYGEPSGATSGTIVAEWGGMPSVVASFQDPNDAVVINRARNTYGQGGETGAFYGSQQTAWQVGYQEPADDPMSVYLLGG